MCVRASVLGVILFLFSMDQPTAVSLFGVFSIACVRAYICVFDVLLLTGASRLSLCHLSSLVLRMYCSCTCGGVSLYMDR